MRKRCCTSSSTRSGHGGSKGSVAEVGSLQRLRQQHTDKQAVDQAPQVQAPSRIEAHLRGVPTGLSLGFLATN